MHWIRSFAVAALGALLPLAAAAPAAAQRPATVAEVRAPVTLLVSIDAFRYDYLERGRTPVLSRLAAEGATGPMRPSFPSKTFPNHWTLVTGLRPDRHGIVANKMEDPARPKESFTMASEDPFWWNAAAPIWVDAEQAGIRTASMFWPGSNIAIGGKLVRNRAEGGTRPSDWQQFSNAVTGEQRVNTILDWMRRPAAIRPRFMTLYFDIVDSAGHAYGPDDPRTLDAIATVDAQIGTLVDGFAALGQPVNLIVAADHGMAAIANDRVVTLDRLVAPDTYRAIEFGAFAALNPLPGEQARVEKALLGHHPHMDCWRKSEIPARFHYGSNPRVPAIFCLAETGWSIAPGRPEEPIAGGNHGFDPAAPEMAALFIAHGPAFRPAQLPGFDNVDVYPLLRDLLGLPAKAGVDGSDAAFRPALR